MMKATDIKPPDIQLIANLVVLRVGAALLLRSDPENPAWRLPGDDLLPYEHPDEAAGRVLAGLGLSGSPTLAHIESFRGRRGWHVIFHYGVDVDQSTDPVTDLAFAWHAPDAFPRTQHAAWEADNARRVLAALDP